MRRNVKVGLAFLCCLKFSFPLLAADLTVVHAEVPHFTEVAKKARLTGTVLVRAEVDSHGNVIASRVERDLPLGLGKVAVLAASLWKFNPSPGSGPREARLAFVFEQRETPEPEREDAFLEDPLTLHVLYRHSTMIRLPREGGAIPEKLCPVHGIPMEVEVLSIPSGCGISVVPNPGSPAFFYEQDLEEARRTLFPETHRTAEGWTLSPGDTAETYYCQACRDAEEAWLASHPAPAPE